MTLNIVATSPDCVIQASDRRATDRSGHPLTDEANKAVIVRCNRGLIGVTFAGVGGWGARRLDFTLAEQIVRKGLAELEVPDVVSFIQEFGKAWMRPAPYQPHLFSVSGWQDLESEQVSHWIVSNVPEGRYHVTSSGSISPPPERRFSVSHWDGTRCFATGMVEAISRASRRRITAASRSTNPLQMESALRDAVRFGNDDGRFGYGIGREVMTVVLLRAGPAFGTLYTDSGEGASHGPIFVWYGAGRNVMVGCPSIEVLNGYTFSLEGNPPGVVARRRLQNKGLEHLEIGEGVASHFAFLIDSAKHHPHDARREFTPFSIHG